MSALGSWTSEDWRGRIGTVFVLHDGGGPELALELVECVPFGEGTGSFSLLFRGPDGTHWPQGSYRVVAEGGEDHLFVVPVGPDGDGRMRYEMVFNRLD